LEIYLSNMSQADPNQITFFAKTNFRNREVPFGIKADDRRRHMYLIGKTGMGKTTLMENMAIQDIRNGHGVCFVDPHGDSVVRMLDFIPNDRVNDVVYFNPADLENPIAFNIMEAVEGKFKHLVASGLMGVFTKIWAGVWSARMEYILGNTVRALLESPGNSMLGITRMYIDKQYRKRIVDNIKDPMVRIFWTDEYANYDQKFVKEAIAPIQNKVGQFLSSAIIRNIVGQPKSSIDLREIMDNRKILLMDISKGKVGEENAALLGAMVITKLQLAAMSRVDMLEEERPDFYLYVDEFQNFATESFGTILSEARKYHLNLIMGHQYIGQLTPTRDNTRLKDAIFGNVGTMICFRIGAADAEFLETEFAPTYTPNDLVNLPKWHVLLKLMINGVSSEPFSARSIAVNPEFRTGNAEKVVKVSRERYGNPVQAVEERISRWMGAEFHQQSAALAVADGDEGALPAPQQRYPASQPQEPVRRVAEPARNTEVVSEAPPATPQAPDQQKQEFAFQAQEEPAVQRGGQPAEESVEPDNKPLVYTMPEMPKPAPPQPFHRDGGGQQSRPRPTGARPSGVKPYAGHGSEHGRTGGSNSFGSSQNRSERNRAGGPNRPPRTSRGGDRRSGKPLAQSSKTPQKPNIWDTVGALHEEKSVQMADKVSSALGGIADSGPGQKPTPDKAQQGKVVKPGEVHTF
jgi:hypothetical protein